MHSCFVNSDFNVFVSSSINTHTKMFISAICVLFLITLTVLPRYTNDEISSRFLSLILIGLLDAQLIFMILVLSTFGFSPSLAEFSIILVVLSCICWLLLERSAMSSAKSRSSSYFCWFHWMPVCWLSVVAFIVQLIASRNRNDDIKQPCFTPVFTIKLSDNFPV